MLVGGQSFWPNCLQAEWINDADDAWPDVMVLLESGIVVGKHYVQGEGAFTGQGSLEFIKAARG